jgi:hypothetical protein
MKKAILFRIKEGKMGTWKAWCSELSTIHRDEAQLTLVDEKVTHEMVLCFNLRDEDYVIGYVDGEFLPADMSKGINIKHKRMKDECLVRINEAEILYNFRL